MSHKHTDHSSEISKKVLFFTIALNLLITVAEVIGGIISGSLALISDALHNFMDVVAIIITFIAIKLSNKPKTEKYTFGLKRAEILAAIINSSTLIIISFFLIKEAIERFYSPTEIAASWMLIVALIGLIANLISTLLLKKGSENNLNIKAAYFHLLSDAASSLAVIVGALLIMYLKIYWIDPLLTILISIYILFETYKIVKESVDILMMSNAEGINLEEIKQLAENIAGVKNIHHVHIWKLNDNNTHFEAHVEIEDMLLSETKGIYNLLKKELNERYNINHITIQFETNQCIKRTIL